jgi:hypothetical protein
VLESALAGEPDEAMWLSMLLLGLRPGEATRTKKKRIKNLKKQNK